MTGIAVFEASLSCKPPRIPTVTLSFGSAVQLAQQGHALCWAALGGRVRRETGQF